MEIEIIDYLKSFFISSKKDNPFLRHTIAIYLYGSCARGEERVDSDIDIAFAIDECIYKKSPFKSFQEMEVLVFELEKRLNRRVEGVILNGASLIFAYNVLRKGICLYERKASERIIYEVGIDNKFQDFYPFIEELREIKRKDLIGRD